MSAISAHSRRFLNLYKSQKYVDCSFQIDDDIINCHKLILSTASPVFDAMFYGPLSSSSSSSCNHNKSNEDDNDINIDNEKCIRIADINLDTFKIMIEYIYSGEVDFKKLTIDTIIELYYSAEKYLITDLIGDCLNEIRKKLEYKNILEALDLTFYMGLQPLLKILLNFLDKYCLNGNYQFMNTIETNYYHVSRDCLKIIINGIEETGHLGAIWFVQYWCKKECKILGLNESDYKEILKDLNLHDYEDNEDFNSMIQNKTIAACNGKLYIPNYVERRYYKAARPIVISEGYHAFTTKLQSDRLVVLLGFTMHGRILPKISTALENYNSSSRLSNGIATRTASAKTAAMLHEQDYTETFEIHIWANNCVLVHKQRVFYPKLKYNCDTNITLYKNVIMSPGFEYEIKIMWDENSYGAEYPCSLYSTKTKGIHFSEDEQQYFNNHDGGGLLKGIRYLNQL